jgi:carbon-monoxide dehydrogenase medium subunit
MKLPDFDYHSPTSLDEAIALMATPNARVLAGGQSLLPIMAFRLAAPSALVDLRKIKGLDKIEITQNTIHLGPMVRWRDVERHEGLAAALPLLTQAMEHVAHYQIRNRGTVGGSLAHADPAAEMPTIALTCDAVIEVIGSKGKRAIAAADLFTGPLMTSLDGDEIITSVLLPVWPAARRWGFQEFSRRRGDFALAGIAVFFDEDASGAICNAHIGAISVGDTPLRLRNAEAALNGRKIDEASLAEVAAIASAEVDPNGDIHASARYRKALVGTLLSRALSAAANRKD